MKVCIYGAGAVGGVIASRLALSGAETAVIVRGPHLEAIRRNGLRFDSPEGSRLAKVAASDDPADFGPQDLVIAAVKAHQLPAIARGLVKLLRADTPVVYAINGIPWWYFRKVGGPDEGRRIERLDPGGELWDLVGVDRTIGCVVNLGGSVPSPGVVDNPNGSKRLALGELGGEQSDRLRDVAAVLRSGGLTVDIERPIRHEMWNKLVLNITTTPISVLTSAPPGQASAADAGIKTIARMCCEEAYAIAAAYGAPRDREVDAIIDSLNATHRPSILQDLDLGRAMEIDPQLTVPIEMAHAAGVAVPTLDMLAALVRARARVAGLYQG